MEEKVEDWDYYPCRVDDKPASIFLDLALASSGPRPSSPHLLWIGLQIIEGGEHEMGVEPDVSELYELEDSIVCAAQALGMVFIGRLRNGGDWQLTFQGRPEDEAALEPLVIDALGTSHRGYRVGGQPDPDWSYYFDFLYPPAERLQWISDRRAVDQLRKRGDALSVPRAVEHRVEFDAGADLENFYSQVRQHGFKVSEVGSPPAGRVVVGLVREDALDGLQIHSVVMNIIALSAPDGGHFLGWSCPFVPHKG